MKTVTEMPSFQGDLMIRRIDTIPATAKRAEPEGDVHIVAHSETGHHHVVASRNADKFVDEMNTFVSWLDVADDAVLEHMRSFDTHESYLLTPGKYEIRNQREYTPEGWRRAAD